MMPVLGSLGLYGLNLAYNYVEKAYVNNALASYVALMGALATTQVGVNTISPIVKMLGIKLDRWHLNLQKKTGGTQKLCLYLEVYCILCQVLRANCVFLLY